MPITPTKCVFWPLERAHPLTHLSVASVVILLQKNLSDLVTNTYLEGIKGAAENEQAIVSQRGDHGQVGGVANEVDLADAGVVMDHLRAQRGKQLEPASTRLKELSLSVFSSFLQKIVNDA